MGGYFFSACMPTTRSKFAESIRALTLLPPSLPLPPDQHPAFAVWSSDEWFKNRLGEDQQLGDQLEFESLEPEAVAAAASKK